MAATSHIRGHRIEWIDGQWRYSDTGEVVDHDRPQCARCGREPTEKGHDACLGHIPGARFACCGHGIVYIVIGYGQRRSIHHEKQVSDEIIRAMQEVMTKDRLGATGNFPDGKLTDNDEGEIRFAVAILKGKVVINFGEPITSLGMSRVQARKLGQLLIRIAAPKEAGNGRRRKRK